VNDVTAGTPTNAAEEGAFQQILEVQHRAAGVRGAAIGAVRKAMRLLRRMDDGNFDDEVAIGFLMAAVRKLRRRNHQRSRKIDTTPRSPRGGERGGVGDRQ
jgi:hypothetical protein